MVKYTMESDNPEVRKEDIVNTVVKDSLDVTCRLIVHFSDWRKLKVTVAWFLRLRMLLLERNHRKFFSKLLTLEIKTTIVTLRS